MVWRPIGRIGLIGPIKLDQKLMSSVVNIPPQFEIVDRPLDTQMTISMGPQHPSTHGVLRLELVLDGEMVV